MSRKDSRDWPDRVDDILRCAARIATLIEGFGYDDFLENEDVAEAVQFNLLIIGEAAGRAPPDVQQALPDVPWTKIKGMRNAIAHGYWAIDLEVVWKTARESMPAFIAALDSLKPNDPEDKSTP